MRGWERVKEKERRRKKGDQKEAEARPFHFRSFLCFCWENYMEYHFMVQKMTVNLRIRITQNEFSIRTHICPTIIILLSKFITARWSFGSKYLIRITKGLLLMVNTVRVEFAVRREITVLPLRRGDCVCDKCYNSLSASSTLD